MARMHSVELPVPSNGVASRLSVLGFGCGALMGRVGRRDSLRALAAAEDAGINFFDTARSYGYGESEGLLGQYLKGRRAGVVLCTKFGIVPARRSWKQALKPAAQAAIRIFPGLRASARRHAAASQPGQFSLENLRTSFETSLRELQTDYVDMLLLHAATIEVLDKDDLFEALLRLVEQGKVRMAGISGDHVTIAATFRRRPAALTTAQFAMNRSTLQFAAETRSPGAERMLLVANHPFGGPAGVAATAESIAAMRTAPALQQSLREKLAEGDTRLMPEILLNIILRNTGVHAVVPSMMRPANLRLNLQAVEHCRFTDEELRTLREALTGQEPEPAAMAAR
jgi:aryl-alcohol dehydrogenase-like predicted oxidoreductase